MNSFHASCGATILLVLLWKVEVEMCFGLTLTQLQIPRHVLVNSDVSLECIFDMEGAALYAVKWYKDGNEFYRFTPANRPQTQSFLLPGVSVNLQMSGRNVLLLSNVSLDSSGLYCCEVSAEAPTFLTVSATEDMHVIAPPKTEPTITGARPWYQIGDKVSINCSSGLSKPATTLAWFLNGQLVDRVMLQRYEPVTVGRHRMERSVLGLGFTVQPGHFRGGSMKLKCLATLPQLNYQSQPDETHEQPAIALQSTYNHRPSAAGSMLYLYET
uniref:Putative secreted protein n=2 Tax=Anopheles triannulatus TaxID=58253 RepID=A0A2M4A5H8_9DIPT